MIIYSNTKESALTFVRDMKIRILFGFGLTGICNVARRANFSYAYMLFNEWDEFSGNLPFPVPSENGKHDARTMFISTINYWNRFSKYGRARIRLAKFIINYIEQNIDKFQ